MPRQRQPRTEEQIAEGKRAFADLRAVIEGRLCPRLTTGAAKVLHFLLTTSKTDTLISPDGFEVRAQGNYGPHFYFARFAPTVVHQLLGWAQPLSGSDVSSAMIPAVVSPLDRWERTPCKPRRPWLSVDEGQVSIALRTLGEAPEGEGWPAQLERPSLIKRTAPLLRDFAEGIVCPHCSLIVCRARDLGDGFVCPHCARSFLSRRTALTR